MNDTLISNAAMVPVVNQNDDIVGYEDEVNRQSVMVQQWKSNFVSIEKSTYNVIASKTKQSHEIATAHLGSRNDFSEGFRSGSSFSAEDIVGLIFCLGGLNPLCLTGCAVLFGPSVVTNPPATEEDKQVENSILKAMNYDLEPRRQGMMELYNLAQSVESLNAKARMMWPLIRHLEDQDVECRKLAAMTLKVLAASNLSVETKTEIVKPLMEAYEKEDRVSPAADEMYYALKELVRQGVATQEQNIKIAHIKINKSK